MPRRVVIWTKDAQTGCHGYGAEDIASYYTLGDLQFDVPMTNFSYLSLATEGGSGEGVAVVVKKVEKVQRHLEEVSIDPDGPKEGRWVPPLLFRELPSLINHKPQWVC